MSTRRLLLLNLSSAALAACTPLRRAADAASTGPGPAAGSAATASAARGPFVAANANLVVSGIPPIPQRIADDVARYNDFRGHGFVDWHPTKREMIVAHRRAGADTTQLFRLASPLGALEPMTDGAEPVRAARYEPGGNGIVFARASGGDEAAQLLRLDLATRRVTTISLPGMRHDLGAFLHRSNRLLHTSLPLDRTAAGGTRREVTTTITLVDPTDPASRRVVAELAGGGWSIGAVSPDDRSATLSRYRSAAESEVHVVDLASGAVRRLLPAAGDAATASWFAGPWRRDGSGFFVASDHGSEFRELMLYTVGDSRLAPLSRHVKADVDDTEVSADGRIVAATFNVDGRNDLRFFDASGLQELPQPAVGNASVTQIRFHPKLPDLAYALNGHDAPSRVATLDPSRAAATTWTTPESPPGIDPRRFGAQRIVRWTSFDGLAISGLLSHPPARFAGKRPVLIDIHGGPEGQARFGFLGRTNYFVEELGIAVLRPNVRGSSGFGKTFLSLDNGMKREDSVKDIGALLDWIAGQPDLDASRVLVQGGSYGGYMSLAVATHYADRIAGAVDVVGISDFNTFLRNTESYRRDLRRVEYGDERDPAMRAFFERISPLANAAKIKRPLFVVQGRNDPRVPYTEAEQIVRKVREGSTTVWYLRAENEGHGFARKENADFQFYATVQFMRQTLLK